MPSSLGVTFWPPTYKKNALLWPKLGCDVTISLNVLKRGKGGVQIAFCESLRHRRSFATLHKIISQKEYFHHHGSATGGAAPPPLRAARRGRARPRLRARIG
jgi:hypothetical protein